VKVASKRQITANQKNAQKSTGPKSETGKRASRANASKHLVFARDIVADHEDQDLFDRLLERLVIELEPETQIESSIVERLAVTIWRERRLAVAERVWLTREHEYHTRVALQLDTRKNLALIMGL
jgi:hypothetical protein